MIRNILVFLLIFCSIALTAQENQGPNMADTFRNDGKIYVVISVISIIFFSIVLFLIYLERKIKRLEDKLKDH
jgi:uncharacterized membrane protein YciS (DUF1049 family)